MTRKYSYENGGQRTTPGWNPKRIAVDLHAKLPGYATASFHGSYVRDRKHVVGVCEDAGSLPDRVGTTFRRSAYLAHHVCGHCLLAVTMHADVQSSILAIDKSGRLQISRESLFPNHAGFDQGSRQRNLQAIKTRLVHIQYHQNTVHSRRY